ncbi:zinc ribbon domain-containing protein [Sporomusa malonica]|uniref:Zinc-ribbon domain-containing protein n=1 Tax=Sporomusa malonica TaxID=112901 RepID=A0A1W2CXG5_9FIRM|nr:zinc ribbon domain-containing protein [Sporomusa malonica]SMC89949.1 hypothetical protein SAMN04488500_11283 [Sporomusa malonica]
MPFCGECGSEIKKENHFCEGCGRAVNVAVAAPARNKAADGAVSSFLKNKKMVLIGTVAALLTGGFLAFGSDDVSGKSVPSQLTPKKAAAAGSSIKLETYNGGFFTIEKPAGWQLVTAGQGPTLGVWMRDPQEPARQVFFFGAVGPVYLSQQQKSIDQQYMAMGGYSVPWSDMPVVSPPTASNFLSKWNAVTNSRIARNYMAELPQFNGLTIISTQPVPSQYGGGTTELVRALFTLNGKVVEGLFTTTVFETVPFVNGPGGHQAYALMFMGVTAPQREFIHAQDPLIRSLSSFSLSEQYVQSYIASSREAFAGVMRAGQTLRETSDIITKGWTARQKTYDILSAKRSDAMLGKERLRDPQTGEVYEFQNGWYKEYDIHRNKFNNSSLQPIPDNDYDGWTAATLNGPNHVYIK